MIGDAQSIFDLAIPEPNSGCWLWCGTISGDGYGSLFYAGRSHRAHRVAWAEEHGEDPGDGHVMHSCDTPLCVNPDHLKLGTHQENMADKARKARGGRALLLEDQVHRVVAMRYRRKMTVQAIADNVGVSKRCVEDVLYGKSYRHILQEPS
jgi:hypothetical protein